MRYIIRNLKEGRELCARLGVKLPANATMAQMQRAVNAVTRNAKPTTAKPTAKIAPVKPVGPADPDVYNTRIEAAKTAGDWTALSNLYQNQSADLLARIAATPLTDQLTRSDLTREFQKAQANHAYALRAEKELTPGAAKARKFGKMLRD